MKTDKACLLIDTAIPDDSNINIKETEKLSKYKTWRSSSAGCGK
jgi:hypothetical protein